MIKAKDFLHYVCNDLGYRSFSGYPSKGFVSLYRNMSPEFMHYIPTIRSDIAFSLVLGTALGGIKSAVLINSSDLLEKFESLNKTVLTHDMPFLVLVFNNTNIKKLPIKTFNLKDNFKSVLKRADTFSIKNKKPCAILIESGVIE